MATQMTTGEREAAQVKYFTERYGVIAHFPFVAPRPFRLCDHDDETKRRCRFCGRGKPEVTFRKEAHAVPHLLGNKSILSLNECDECNAYLGQYEDQLGKWSLFARALSRIPGKKNKMPTFKGSAGKLRIEPDGNGASLHLPAPHSPDELRAGEITIEEDTASQTYVPVDAAKALVKIACSVCPPRELEQCQTAIEWLMGRRGLDIKPFPVFFAFTPGPISDRASDIILLRRKGDGPEPYLWCIVQFGNHRFQVFVPFCPADGPSFRKDGAGGSLTFSMVHCPSKFGPNWPYGPTEYGHMDWSGEEPVRSPATASICVERVISVQPPERKRE